MDADISKILKSWSYEPNALILRKIVGENEKEKIQIRINLGILQMEVEGRPDGKTPHNSESLIEYYTSIIDEFIERDGNSDRFVLNKNDMEELDKEIMQYYHRRICFFALQDYSRAKEDAEHNIKLMDIIKKHCKDKDYLESHEKFRPFVLMERARGAGLENIKKGDYASAIKYIGDTIDMIQDFYNEYGASEEEIRKSQELKILKKWRSQIHQDWEGGATEIEEDDDDFPYFEE
ncbi:hypothetical protein FJZ33_10870 [Candidatus Poribacteria bacterium]|nr:hypothetical protein [Candidatus Poribacteria bacterium]